MSNIIAIIFLISLIYSSKPAWKDGTTVTIVIIINDILYSANLGDSKVSYYLLN